MKNDNFFLTFILEIIVAVIVIFITSAILMWLWNIVIVYIFGLPTLTYGYAIGLMIISNLLFKSPQYSSRKA